MRQVINQISIFILVILFFACSAVEQKNNKKREIIYSCNAEERSEQNGQFREISGKDLFFGNANCQTSDFSVSGKFSIKLSPKNPYGFTTDVPNVYPDEYIEVTVWRKGVGDNGVIALDGGNGLYSAKKDIIEKNENGWSKLILEYHIPPTFESNKIKVYVWNNSQDTVYFDDLEITHRSNKNYPEYSGIPGLIIHSEKADLQHFQQKRISAFETTVLVNSDEDYANTVIFDGTNFLNGKFRLKGDLLDHIQGQKWSFRIKLKKGFSWKNMRTFSIQNPSTRGFLYEWLAHKLFLQEGLLTTRYGFVPISLNNKSLGIYAWEEHFEKQLVESQNRREGPIIRFNENLFWQRILETNQTKREWDIDYFGAAKIIPFKEGSTAGDSLLNLELVEAQKLLLQYKNMEVPVSKIFDINKLAKYYALIDITQAYHGFAWHNQRFYYNPVTCLLEPIAFDGYIDGGIYKRIDEQITGLLDPSKLAGFRKEELILFQVFADKSFQIKYLENLDKYSQSEFINNLISSNKNQADSLSVLIKKEFLAHTFNFNYIKWQAEYIQNHFDEIERNVPEIGNAFNAVSFQKFEKSFTSDLNKNLLPFLVHAYYDSQKKQITVLNYHADKIKILGVFVNDGLPESFESTPEILAYNGLAPNKITLSVSSTPVKLLFEVAGQMLETEISSWAYKNEKSCRQITLLNKIPENIIRTENQIIFDGMYQFDKDVVIPDSMQVIAKPGTKIDLINNAAFICFSTISFQGTKENSVIITSSDQSSNGLHILQAQDKSLLTNVQFSSLGNLKKSGWQTPSAVTFYESDVEFDNCIFGRNVNCDDALNVVRSHFFAKECTFEDTFADAFDSDFCTGDVVNCRFVNVGNDAIDFSGSYVKISDCNMFEIGDKAISGGENSHLQINNCNIEKANIGVASKDLSVLELEKITMNTTVYGLVAFVKKPEYGPAKIFIKDLKLNKNMVFHQIEEGSLLELNGTTIEGREKNLAKKLYQ